MALWISEARGGDYVVRQTLLAWLIVSHRTPRTCFWAGDTFTPKLKATDPSGKQVSIQTFLQQSFLDMWAALARAVGDLDGVLGFEVLCTRISIIRVCG